MENLVCAQVKEIFGDLKEMSIANRDYLIELDAVMGDGDLGLTMTAAFIAAADFTSSYDDEDIGSMLMKTGMIMAKAAPSTMGTLMATGFMRGGKAIKGVSTIGLVEMNDFWEAFVTGIMDRGKAKPGEKTIIDALYPVMVTYKDAVNQNRGFVQAAKEAKYAAEQGVEATKNMIAQHGRIAYYQERSRTIQDPGATIGALVVGVFSDYITA